MEKGNGEVQIPSVCKNHGTADGHEQDPGIYRAEHRNEYGIHTGQPRSCYVQICFFSAMWIKRNSYPEEDTGKAESSVIMRNWKDTRKNSRNMWLRSKSADQTGTVIPKQTMTPHL